MSPRPPTARGPEVEAAVAEVRSAHRPVRGESARGKQYSAAHPELAAWVHNVLTDSFLAAYQTFGPGQLSEREADQFVTEQATIGALLGASPLPLTARELSAWVADHPAAVRIRRSGQRDSVPSRSAAPARREAGLPTAVRRGGVHHPVADHRHSRLATVTSAVPHRRSVVGGLRWTLGSSPSWHLALVRAGAPVPSGLFRQPLPPGAAEVLRAADLSRAESPD